MPVTTPRRNRPFKPALRKTFIATQEGYDVYAVNAFAVRNYARPDEEFTNFAMRDEFPDLIPPDEIWVADTVFEKEGVFFVANALTRLKALERGLSEQRAYAEGISAERALREKTNRVKFRDGRPHPRVPKKIYAGRYIELPDPKYPVEVWLVDGNLARSWYKTDYTEGGHSFVYQWVPNGQIWVEKDLHPRELPYIVCHEYLEMRLMREERLDYDTAHEICSKVEFNLRKGRGAKPLIAPGRHRLAKRHLRNLTRDEVYEYVLRTYVKKT